MADAGRAQILAFRLASHNLTDRLEAASVVDAAAACGIQETPTASAALSLLPLTRKAIEAEAQRIAPFRDDRAVEVHLVASQ